MIAVILTITVVWCLFYGRVSSAALLPVCIAVGFVLALHGRHKHTRFLAIDVLAQVSRFNTVNSDIKLWTALALMLLCVASRSVTAGLFLTVVAAGLVVMGGIKFHEYLHLLTLPLNFLLLSGLVLLFEVTAYRTGVIGIRLPWAWLCVSAQSQARTALVISRALGAVSTLYALSLTTPMTELIGVLRRVRCPGVITDLMYLIYRYIFIFLLMHSIMQDAAKSRLGYSNIKTSIHTTGKIYSNLLARSYRQANLNFDAMESRCYDTEIRFLENNRRITGIQALIAAVLMSVTFALSLFIA